MKSVLLCTLLVARRRIYNHVPRNQVLKGHLHLELVVTYLSNPPLEGYFNNVLHYNALLLVIMYVRIVPKLLTIFLRSPTYNTLNLSSI